MEKATPTATSFTCFITNQFQKNQAYFADIAEKIAKLNAQAATVTVNAPADRSRATELLMKDPTRAAALLQQRQQQLDRAHEIGEQLPSLFTETAAAFDSFLKLAQKLTGAEFEYCALTAPMPLADELQKLLAGDTLNRERMLPNGK